MRRRVILENPCAHRRPACLPLVNSPRNSEISRSPPSPPRPFFFLSFFFCFFSFIFSFSDASVPFLSFSLSLQPRELFPSAVARTLSRAPASASIFNPSPLGFFLLLRRPTGRCTTRTYTRVRAHISCACISGRKAYRTLLRHHSVRLDPLGRAFGSPSRWKRG